MGRLLRREEVLAAVPILHGVGPSRLISCSPGMGAERTPKRGPETGSEAARPCVEPWKKRDSPGAVSTVPDRPGAIRAGWNPFPARKINLPGNETQEPRENQPVASREG